MFASAQKPNIYHITTCRYYNKYDKKLLTQTYKKNRLSTMHTTSRLALASFMTNYTIMKELDFLGEIKFHT